MSELAHVVSFCKALLPDVPGIWRGNGGADDDACQPDRDHPSKAAELGDLLGQVGRIDVNYEGLF